MADSFTPEELIREALDGKSAAAGKYDEFIWRVRSGYLVVIYGALTVIAASAKDESLLVTNRWVAPGIIAGFSAAAGIIDYTFLRSKFRVVVTRNYLIDCSWHLASGKSREILDDSVGGLLRISGERDAPQRLREVRSYLWAKETLLLLFTLYGFPAIGAIVLFFVA